MKKTNYLQSMTFIVLFVLFSIRSPITGYGESSHATIIWEKGKLSVIASNNSLSSILKELGRVTGIEIECMQKCEENVSTKFIELSIEDGLKKLLHNRNYLIEVSKTANGDNYPVRIVILGSETNTGEEKHETSGVFLGINETEEKEESSLDISMLGSDGKKDSDLIDKKDEGQERYPLEDEKFKDLPENLNSMKQPLGDEFDVIQNSSKELVKQEDNINDLQLQIGIDHSALESSPPQILDDEENRLNIER